MDQVYVLLFSVAKHYGEDMISSNEYVEFATTLQKLIVRMQVCEKSTNKLDNMFATCIDLMKDKAAPIALITQKLKDEISSTVDDTVFFNAFAKFCPNDNKVAEFYLRHLENELRRENGNRTPVPRKLTVEHIIPQNALYNLAEWYGNPSIPEDVADDYKQSVIESIGNKALLYGDDNSSANDNKYEYKLDVYKNGKRGQDSGTPVNTFKLIEDVVTTYPSKFLHDDVEDRAKRLAKYAIKIW